MKGRLIIFLRVAGFIAAGLALAVAAHMGPFLLRTPSGDKEFREVLIPEGTSFREVATTLKKKGIITDKERFIILGKLLGVTKKVRAGFYSLNTRMRPLRVLEQLEKGRIIEYQVVLPEGYTIDDIASLLDETGLTDSGEFLAKVTDPGYVASLGLEGSTLEGYLFPATYYMPKGITLEGIISRLVSKYRDVFGEDFRNRAGELGMSEREVVILASLIEREALLDSERLLISAVFHNRLRQGIKLQCDPTVIYSLKRKGRWTGRLTRADLRMKDPYNTYVNYGLPPGPIANPGKPSIIAALYPADVDYIFFVSKNDGTHFFSSSLAEHNRAVMEYQVLTRTNVQTGEDGRDAEEKVTAPARAKEPEG